MISKINLGLLCYVLVIVFIGCSKDDPINPDDKTLQPQSEISLASFLSEPSGIVYRLKSNTLFVVSDTAKKIYELDLSGNLISSINVTGNDLEGITFSLTEDTIYVVEESGNKITSYNLSGTKIKSFVINVSTISSNGLEGLAFDNTGSLYVINEKAPRYLIKTLNDVEVFRKEIIVSDDLSDICYDKTLNCLWLVSDESKKIIKLSKEGILQSEWSIPFDKGEGITFVQDNMYIVNDETSKLYIFTKPQ